MITDELNDIKKYIEEGEMSFLVGAGFSRNVNKEAYPLWGGLLKDAIWNMFGEGNRTKQKEKKVLEKVEKEYGYLGFASMMVNKAGYHESIDTYIESKTPFIKTIGDKPVLLLNGKQLPNTVHSDAHLLLKNLNIQNIYTFNYDNALEFFMGEDAKRMLEEKIKNSESSIESLKKEISDLDQKERSLGENNEGTNPGSRQLNQELEEIQRKKNKKTSELSELRAGLETDKWNLRTYYNVVKDSSEISLSAKRKSIYKIHGSLRENPNAEYGFDGDTHAQYIITKEDYDAYNEKHGAFVSMMRIDLLRNRFCIIGVSGGDANFLAWINWVKDVLDNTEDRVRQGKENQHQSYFIYSGNNDMPEDLVLMLKNHFIQPVILKNVFPKSQSDEERIKLFLEYVQPISNNDSARFSKLWNEINVPRSYSKSVDKVSITVAEELFRLSSCNKYNGPHSTAQYVATDVQFEANHYLNDATPRSERLVYAAALQSTLMPVDLTCDRADFIQMDKETDRDIIAVFRNACRRAVLLQHLSGKGKKLAKEDKYTFFNIKKHL